MNHIADQRADARRAAWLRRIRHAAGLGALAACLALPVAAAAAPTVRTALGQGAFINLDPACDPSIVPANPHCSGQVYARLVYLDPDDSAFNLLDQSAVLSFKLYALTNGGSTSFQFNFPQPDPQGQFITALAIQESEDFLAVGFTGNDLDVQSWTIGLDGSFDFASHGEEIMGHAGALVWKVPEPGTLLLCALALATLLGQRRAQQVSARRPAPPRRSPRS